MSVFITVMNEITYLTENLHLKNRAINYLYIYMIKCSTSTKKCHVKYQICNRSGRAPIASKIKVHIQHIANHCK